MIISIFAKCSDMFSLSVHKDGMSLIEHDGYVPDIPSIGGGDYVEIEIDNDTGTIVGWKPLTLEQIKEAIENA